jgi:hypothetical protein
MKGFEDKVLEVLENRYKRKRTIEKALENRQIHGSDTQYCLKKTYLSYMNPEPFDRKTCVKFELGNLAEEFLKRYEFPELDWQKELKTNLTEGWSLVSHPDFVDPYTSNIISVKTTTMKYGKLFDGWETQLFREMKGYLLQYPNFPLPQGTILVWHLNERDICFYHYDYGVNLEKIDNVWIWTVSRANKLVYCFLNNKMPEEFEEQGWECGYCAYRDKICKFLKEAKRNAGKMEEETPAAEET